MTNEIIDFIQNFKMENIGNNSMGYGFDILVSKTEINTKTKKSFLVKNHKIALNTISNIPYLTNKKLIKNKIKTEMGLNAISENEAFYLVIYVKYGQPFP